MQKLIDTGEVTEEQREEKIDEIRNKAVTIADDKKKLEREEFESAGAEARERKRSLIADMGEDAYRQMIIDEAKFENTILHFGHGDQIRFF